MSVRFRAEPVRAADLKPGELWSELGPERWENAEGFGAKVYVRARGPVPPERAGAVVYRITVEPEAERVELVNVTGHTVTIRPEAGGEIVLGAAPRGDEGRMDLDSQTGLLRAASQDGRPMLVPVHDVRPETLRGLPPSVPGVTYVASVLTAAVAGRPDVLAPHRQVRSGVGAVTFCRALLRFPAARRLP